MIVYPYVAAQERLRLWHSAQALALATYRLSGYFPRHELWGITSQMRRASVSIAANIAEGANRGGTKEFRQFLLVARGSLAELETYLRLVEDLNYAQSSELREIWVLFRGIEKGINALLAALHKQSK